MKRYVILGRGLFMAERSAMDGPYFCALKAEKIQPGEL